jgi:hypothetical protein
MITVRLNHFSLISTQKVIKVSTMSHVCLEMDGFIDSPAKYHRIQMMLLKQTAMNTSSA